MGMGTVDCSLVFFTSFYFLFGFLLHVFLTAWHCGSCGGAGLHMESV
jgi:hypothetical protein